LYELRRNLRRKGYLFTTFGIPLLAVVLLLGYQFITSRTGEADAGDAPPPEQTLLQQFDFENVGRAGYVDLSGMFDDPGRLAPLLTPYPDEAAARAALDAGEIPMYYRIAPDFLDTGDVTIVQPRLNFSQLQTDPIERMVLNTLSQDVD